MVNSKEVISLAEIMQVSRYDLVEAHLGYMEPDEDAHTKQYWAVALNTVVRAKVEEKVDNKGEEKEENTMAV